MTADTIEKNAIDESIAKIRQLVVKMRETVQETIDGSDTMTHADLISAVAVFEQRASRAIGERDKFYIMREKLQQRDNDLRESEERCRILDGENKSLHAKWEKMTAAQEEQRQEMDQQAAQMQQQEADAKATKKQIAELTDENKKLKKILAAKAKA